MPDFFKSLKGRIKSKSTASKHPQSLIIATVGTSQAVTSEDHDADTIGESIRSAAPAGRFARGNNLSNLKIALGLLDTLATDIGVPGLKSAASVLVKILESVDKKDENAMFFEVLATRIMSLEGLLSEIQNQSSVPTAWQGFFVDLEREFKTITDLIQRFSSRGRIMSILNAEDDASSVAVYVSNLDKILSDLRTAVALEIYGQVTAIQTNTQYIEEHTQSIQGHTQDIHNYLLSKEQEDYFNELPYVASATYNSLAREFAPKCLNGTRVDLLMKIQQWIGASPVDSPSLFWLSGLAGTGKTTISQSVADYCDEHHLLGASFFFSQDKKELQVTNQLLSTLAFQIGIHFPLVKRHIADALKDKTVLTLSMHIQLQRLIIKPLAAVKDSLSSLVVIVLDALDECEDTDAVSHIVKMFASALHGQELPLKVFCTSRPVNHLNQTFGMKDVDSNTSSIVLHEIDMPVVQKDIRTYLSFKLGEIASAHPQGSGAQKWPLEEDIDVLVDRAAGLFVYASTVVKFIEYDGDLPEDRLAMLLNNVDAQVSYMHPYAQLDHLYDQILCSMAKASQRAASSFAAIVGTIIVIFDYLSCKDLSQLLRMRETEILLTLKYLHSVIIVPKSDGVIQAFHPSFHDYLTDENRCKNSNFFINAAAKHVEIAKICLDRMSESLKQDICQINDFTKLNEEIEDLEYRKAQHLPHSLQYACLHWMSHISAAGILGHILVSKVRDFINAYLLYWIEAMSLVKQLDSGLQCISQAQKWLSAIPDPPRDLVEMLYDAERFILEFYAILSKASLHTYYSALPFTPSGTALAKQFAPVCQNSVRVINGVSMGWDSYLQTMTHLSRVASTAFSPDGKFIVSGSWDYNVQVWKTETGEAVHTFVGHSDGVNSVAFSPNGKFIVSGSSDNTVKIWTAGNDEAINTLNGHEDWVTSVSFSPDGKLIVSTSDDETLRIWKSETGEAINILLGHSNTVTSAAFTPNGKFIVSGSTDHTVKVWRTSTGEAVKTLMRHSDWVRSVAVSPNGRFFASGSADNTICIWGMGTWEVINTLIGHTMSVRSVAFSPDSQFIVSGSFDKTVHIWKTETGEIFRTFTGHSDRVRSVTFSPDGGFIMSGSYDHTVRIWRVNSSEVMNTLARCADNETPMAFTDSSFDGTVQTHMTGTSEPVKTLIGHSDHVENVEFSSDGRYISSYAGAETIIWDADTGIIVHSRNKGSEETFPEIGDNLDEYYWQPLPIYQMSSTLAYCIQNEWLYKFHNNTIQRVCWLPQPCRGFCLSQYQQKIAVGAYSGRVVILDLSAMNNL